MNWIKESANDLKNLTSRKHAVTSIEKRIKILEDNIVSLRSASAETPTQTFVGGKEENIINYIAEKEKLSNNLKITKEIVYIIESALLTLTDKQRRILEVFFIERVQNHIDILCEELNVERSTVYRLKDEALYKFTIAMYGVADL